LRLNSIAISTITLSLFIFVQVAVAAPPNDVCNLPEDLQHEIAAKYPGAKVVNLSDLGEDGRRLFQKDHGDACLGLVRADFYGDGKPALALVLITKRDGKGNAELVVAHKIGQHSKSVLLELTPRCAPILRRKLTRKNPRLACQREMQIKPSQPAAISGAPC
jgi:hypothetical protein